MLLNNVEHDLKTRFIEDGITQTEVAGRIGVSPPTSIESSGDGNRL